jgi:hypothetical protein
MRNLKTFKKINLILVSSYKIIFILLILQLVQGCIYDTSRPFDGGNGSEENPYRISTLEQLQEIAEEENLDKHFIQIANIDASASKELQNGSGFKNIGDLDMPFSGSYDGNGFVIQNVHIYIQRIRDEHHGLFGTVKNAQLVNITIDNSEQLAQNFPGKWSDFSVRMSKKNDEFSGRRGIGGLVGFNDDGIISNCQFIGRVSGFLGDTIGGIAGLNSGLIEDSKFEGVSSVAGSASGLVAVNIGKIINSHASGRISGMTAHGLAFLNYGEIISSSVDAIVNGTGGASGFVGSNLGGRIESSFVMGEVKGTRRSAGLVLINDGEITNSYSKSEVNVSFVTGSEETEANGLVAVNRVNGLISTSFAAGSLIITDGPGKMTGLAGWNEGILIDTYWDTESTGKNEGVGEGNSNGATGLTTSEMTGPAAEQNMPEFDWVNIWRTTEDGYPVLRWEEE